MPIASDPRQPRQTALAFLETLDCRHLDPQAEAFLPAPMERARGREAIAAEFIAPLRAAFGGAGISPEIVISDQYNDADWVAVMGRLMADQSESYFRVPPGPGRCLRFGIFLRVRNGLIQELRVLFDLPALAAQAGYELLPPFPAGKTTPLPRAEEALNAAPQAAEESARTRDLIAALIGGLNQLQGGKLASMPQEDFWTPDMGWYGPWGIGACHSYEEYQEFAQGPSVRSFPNRRGTWPKAAFVAEGATGAFTGWPSLVGDFTGAPFRGIAPTGGPISQNIMDFYIRRGRRLAQNWVFIDLVRFAADCSVDLLAPLPAA